MTPPDANEKLTRRILGGLGVRPVGHQNPNDGDPGQTTTAPTVPTQRANRLPPWWEAKKPVADTNRQAPTAATGDPAAPVPPKPAARPRDWLDNLLDDNATEPEDGPEPDPAPTAESDGEPDPEPDEEPAEAEPEAKPAAPAEKTKTSPKKKPQKRAKKPKPGAPRAAWDTQPPSPRQSLLDAWDRIPHRLKWLAYHASAAYLGWSMGWVDWCTSVTAWLAQAGRYDPQAIFLYVAFAATFLLHHATRQRWWPVAWLAAVPACSVVVGILLYGNGWTELELSL